MNLPVNMDYTQRTSHEESISMSSWIPKCNWTKTKTEQNHADISWHMIYSGINIYIVSVRLASAITSPDRGRQIPDLLGHRVAPEIGFSWLLWRNNHIVLSRSIHRNWNRWRPVSLGNWITLCHGQKTPPKNWNKAKSQDIIYVISRMAGYQIEVLWLIWTHWPLGNKAVFSNM